jgi:alpha-amylase/alpha-mannosidase (GH57 family)
VKVEIQLISWLNKYDTDVGKKQAEYDEVLAGYEKEQQQMETLKVK